MCKASSGCRPCSVGCRCARLRVLISGSPQICDPSRDSCSELGVFVYSIMYRQFCQVQLPPHAEKAIRSPKSRPPSSSNRLRKCRCHAWGFKFRQSPVSPPSQAPLSCAGVRIQAKARHRHRNGSGSRAAILSGAGVGASAPRPKLIRHGTEKGLRITQPLKAISTTRRSAPENPSIPQDSFRYQHPSRRTHLRSNTCIPARTS